MTDYWNQPHNQPPQPPQSPYPSNPYTPQSPYPAQNPPSDPFPASFYPQAPQSPPIGVPQAPQSQPFPSPSFPSYYTTNQQPEPPKSKARLVLILAAVLFFAVAGVFGGLYVATESDHDKANSVLEDKKEQLDGVKQDISSEEDKKSTAEKANGDLESQNAALDPCVDATLHFIYDVPSTAPEAEQDAAVQAMRDACK